jgi:hypothetical protein
MDFDTLKAYHTKAQGRERGERGERGERTLR